MPWEVQTELDYARTELPRAKAQWQTADLTNYDLDAKLALGFHPCNLTDITLHIRGGELAGVTDYSQTPGESNNSQAREIVDYKNHRCDFENLMPARIFEDVIRQLKDDSMIETYLEVRFDSEYGFVKDYHVETVSRGVDHCCRYMSFSNLQIVEPGNN